MAKVLGVHTNIRGKVGNEVYQVIKGVQIVKTRAFPANPQSTGQTRVRGVFTELVICFKVISEKIIRPFWNAFTTGNKTGWGNLLKQNMTAMVAVGWDITQMILSIGTLEGVGTLAGVYNAATGDLIITWDETTFTNGALTDKMSFVAIDNSTKSVVADSLCSSDRDDETDTIVLPAGLTATDISLFALLSDIEVPSTDPYIVSDSQRVECTASV